MRRKFLLTARQCQQARALLKWNLGDLLRHTSVSMHRMRIFEKGMCQLQQWESDELVTALIKHGIEFKDGSEVTLSDKSRSSGMHVAEDSQNAANTFDISGDMMSELTREEEEEHEEEDEKTRKKRRK